MIPQDIDTIQRYPFQKNDPVTITLSIRKKRLEKPMTQFCDDLKRLAPHIKIINNEVLTFKETAIIVGRHKNIAYQTIPTGKILPLFLEALDISAEPHNPLPDDIAMHLDQVRLPAPLKLYIADQCPHCPHMTRSIQRLAAGNPLFRLQIINAQMFSDRSQADQIHSVPTLILDNQFRWTGQLNMTDVLTMCTNRDFSRLSADSLRQLIENGDASKVAALMIKNDQIFPGLIDLLTHQRWSVRLGAMVTVEYLADEAPALALALCQLLWKRFSVMAPQIQGDLTHIFGLVEAEENTHYLNRIATGEYDKQVRKAAMEILDERRSID